MCRRHGDIVGSSSASQQEGWLYCQLFVCFHVAYKKLRASESSAGCYHQTADMVRLAHTAGTQDSRSIEPTNLVVKTQKSSFSLFFLTELLASLTFSNVWKGEKNWPFSVSSFSISAFPNVWNGDEQWWTTMITATSRRSGNLSREGHAIQEKWGVCGQLISFMKDTKSSKWTKLTDKHSSR